MQQLVVRQPLDAHRAAREAGLFDRADEPPDVATSTGPHDGPPKLQPGRRTPGERHDSIGGSLVRVQVSDADNPDRSMNLGSTRALVASLPENADARLARREIRDFLPDAPAVGHHYVRPDEYLPNDGAGRRRHAGSDGQVRSVHADHGRHAEGTCQPYRHVTRRHGPVPVDDIRLPRSREASQSASTQRQHPRAPQVLPSSAWRRCVVHRRDARQRRRRRDLPCPRLRIDQAVGESSRAREQPHRWEDSAQPHPLPEDVIRGCEHGTPRGESSPGIARVRPLIAYDEGTQAWTATVHLTLLCLTLARVMRFSPDPRWTPYRCSRANGHRRRTWRR